MVSTWSRAGRGSTRGTYRAKMPKCDPTAAAAAHQNQRNEAPSKEMNKDATLKTDKIKPAVKAPPGLEFMVHATQVEEEVVDQVVPEQVCQKSAVEPPPGLERAAENLPATPETTEPSEVQEAISESDDVATIAENPPYPLHVKDVSECAACSGKMLAPIACCVSIQGLPNAILSEPMVLAMLQQAGLLGAVITFSTCEGDPCGEAHVSFSRVDAALRCVCHFEGCQWDASGTEVMAKMTPLESTQSLESLDFTFGMDAAIDYVCCPAMEEEKHNGATTQEQACETLQEHLDARAQEQACEVHEEHTGAMMSAEAAEFIPCDTESQQAPGVLRADAPAFVAMPSDSMVYETLVPEVYEMVDAEACDFMTVQGSDCMVAFVHEAHHTLLSADSPPFVPSPPILVAARADAGPSVEEEGHPVATVPTKMGVSSDTSTDLDESDADDDKGGGLVV